MKIKDTLLLIITPGEVISIFVAILHIICRSLGYVLIFVQYALTFLTFHTEGPELNINHIFLLICLRKLDKISP